MENLQTSVLLPHGDIRSWEQGCYLLTSSLELPVLLIHVINQLTATTTPTTPTAKKPATTSTTTFTQRSRR